MNPARPAVEPHRRMKKWFPILILAAAQFVMVLDAAS